MTYKIVTSEVSKRMIELADEGVLALLDEREEGMVRLHFGVDGDTFTFELVGSEYGVSRQRAHQIITRALDRLGIDPWDS